MSSSLAPTSEELQRASSASASASAASSSHRRRVHWSPFLVQSHQRLSEHLSHLNFVGRMARLFYLHGKLCASHPWEVIVAFAILAIALFSMGPHLLYDQSSHGQSTTTTTTAAVARAGLAMAAAQSERYFGEDDTRQRMADLGTPPPPHLSPGSYKKSANVLSDDPLSPNRYSRNLSNHQQKQQQQQQKQKQQQHRQQCPQKSQKSLDCAVQRENMASSSSPSDSAGGSHSHSSPVSSEVLIVTISRCLALLYIYHQFKNLYKLGSKYLVGIAVLFTVFSSIIFCTGVLNFLNGNLSVVNKALPFFILLSDLSKASFLAQFALSSSNRDEVHENIARGMATLGPSLTLDTLAETLAIGVGTITGYPTLAEISYFSCLTYLVNYVVFMTVFPAVLSLALESTHAREGVDAPVWQFASLAKVLQLESEHTPNPVIQRVKVVMSAGLMLVHTLRRWPLTADVTGEMGFGQGTGGGGVGGGSMDSTVEQASNGLVGSLTNTATEQILVIGFVCVLAIKYIFFENINNDVPTNQQQQSQRQYSQFGEEMNKNSTAAEAESGHTVVGDTAQMIEEGERKDLLAKADDSESTSSGISESCSNTTSSSPSSTRPTTPTTASSTNGDDLDGVVVPRMGKPATPSILITTQDSDTESVIAEYHRKISESRMLLSSANSSATSSRAGSVKGLCTHHRSHHGTSSSGHGSVATDESYSMPPSLSECEGEHEGSDSHSQSTSPSFFIGDDCCSDCFSSETSPEYMDREVQTDQSITAPPPPPPRPTMSHKSTSCTQALSEEQELQLHGAASLLENASSFIADETCREVPALLELMKQEDGCNLMNDREVQLLVEKQHIPSYKLESFLGNAQRGVAIRRRVIENAASRLGVLHEVPYLGYNYNLVLGACCENVIGYLPLPLGVAGPLLLNGQSYYVPMATTEGCLVASTNRGCRAVSLGGGMKSTVYADGMTRGPVLIFGSAMEAAAAMKWLSDPEHYALLKEAFDSTSRFARLKNIHPRLFGHYLFLRFTAETGDAMGMNMLSKGTERALDEFGKHITGLEMKCLSGNFCTDKKPSAVNWIEGRGKSVVCEALVPRAIVEKVLKTSPEALVDLNISKNLIGSSAAGSIGGNNAQAANIVAAIYIATGQDPAQTVGSSNCMTLVENRNGDLYISCTMPSIEIGTIGGGTVLGPQGACLQLIGVKGVSQTTPGANSSQLAQVVCGTVLAAELSLLSALAAGHLVRSHMKHNRSNININLEATPASLLNANNQQ